MRTQTSPKAELFARALRLIGLGVFALFMCAFFLWVAYPEQTSAATSSTINFQARLQTSGGAIVADGNYNVEFKLYNASSSSGSSQGSCTGDANCLWTETRTGANQVRVVNGYLTVNLGSVTSFPTTINWNQQLWLTMNIGGTSGTPSWDGEMSPRLQLTAVPYAFQAGTLSATSGANVGTLTFGTISGTDAITLPDASGTVCLQSASACGFATGSGAAFIQGGNSFGAQAHLGTTDNNSLAFRTNGGDKLVLQTSGNLQFQQASTINMASSAAGNQLSVQAGAATSGTNAGGNLLLQGGTGASTGASGSVIVKSNVNNSTTAFQVQNASGVGLLTADTSNGYVYVSNGNLGVGTSAPPSPLTVLNTATGYPGVRFDQTVNNTTNVNDAGINVGLWLTPNETAAAFNTDQVARFTGQVTGSFTEPNLYGLTIVAPVLSGGATVTNDRAINIEAQAQAGITNPWAIYQGGASDYNYFAGAVGIGVTKAAYALDVAGAARVQSVTNSTTAFQVQNANGESVLSVDTTTTNFITNPGFEVNTTGWVATGTGASIARNVTAANAYLGYASLKVTTGTTANSGAQVSAFTGTLSPNTYTLSFYAQASTAFTDLVAVITGGSATCTLNSNTVSTTGFQRYYCTFTSTSTNITAITIGESGTTSHIFYLDAAQLNQSSSLSAYTIGGVQLRGVVTAPAVFAGSSNSSTAFQIQNASSVNLFSADSINMRITIGSIGTPVAQLFVSGTLPTGSVGNVGTGGGPQGVAVQGRYAYVVTSTANTFQIFDVSDPTSPVALGSVATGSVPQNVVVQGRYAYTVNLTSSTLQVFDVSNPNSPSVVSSTTTCTSPSGVAVSGSYAYVVGCTGLLTVFDISNPASPVSMGQVAIGNGTMSVTIQGKYAYVTAYHPTSVVVNALYVVDISNPASPSSVGSVTTNSGPNAVAVDGKYAYVTETAANMLQVFNVSNPASPSSVTSVSLAASAQPSSPIIQGRYVYIANYGANTLQVLDISTPGSPTSVGTVSSTTPVNMVMQGRYLYVINGSTNNLTLYDMGGTYSQQLEAGGLEVGTAAVRGALNVIGPAAFAGSVTVGTSLDVGGNIATGSSITAHGQISATGSDSGTTSYSFTSTSVPASGGTHLTIMNTTVTNNIPGADVLLAATVNDFGLTGGGASSLVVDLLRSTSSSTCASGATDLTTLTGRWGEQQSGTSGNASGGYTFIDKNLSSGTYYYCVQVFSSGSAFTQNLSGYFNYALL